MGDWRVFQLGVGLLGGHAQAARYFVDTVDDTLDANPADGRCADSAGRCSLRAAIMEGNVAPGSIPTVIHLPAGQFLLSTAGAEEDVAHSGGLDILRRVSITGAGPALTRIDGAALDRIVDLHAGVVMHLQRLAGLHGSAAGAGAGVRVGASATSHLDDVEVDGHRMRDRTGGIAIDSRGCVHGRHVRLRDNRDDGTPAAPGSTAIRIAAHTANDAACLALDDSEISGNRVDAGGALTAGAAQIILRRSLVSGNKAVLAGALHRTASADARLENLTVSGNRGDPGAVLVSVGAHPDVVGSTVTDNGQTAGRFSEVRGIRNLHPAAGQALLSNTVLAGNGPGLLADDCAGVGSQGGGNHYGDCIDLQALPNDRQNVVAVLGPLAENGGFTRSHLPDALAIDDGWAVGCPRTDQRGQPRAFDHDGDGVHGCDVGAVEVRSPQATFTVDTLADSVDQLPGDGHCDDGQQRCSLRAGIQESNSRSGVDVVVLPPGTFVFGIAGLSEDSAASGDLDITDDLILVGAGSTQTIIDADALDRVIDIRAEAGDQRHVHLHGPALRRGAGASGAGMRALAGARVELEDRVRRDHYHEGFFAATALEVDGQVTGRRVRIHDNEAAGFGASTVTVGAASASVCPDEDQPDMRSVLDLEDCRIGDNLAQLAGALYVACGRMRLSRCLVDGNQGGGVGAMLLNAPALLENVTVTGNSGRGVGAISNDGHARLDILNSTITLKRGLAGEPLPMIGGIRDVHGGAGMTYLANTYLAGNFAKAAVGYPDCNNGFSMGGNLIGDAQRCQQLRAQPDDQLDVVPPLLALADHGGYTQTHRPVVGSGAIDRGRDALCAPTDQRGQSRPEDGDGDGTRTCDVGAFEVESDALFSNGFDPPAPARGLSGD